MNRDIYESASRTNQRNETIARLLQSYGRHYCELPEGLGPDLFVSGAQT